MAAAAKPVLSYFPLKGRGEVSRLLAAEGKIAIDDNRVDFKDWPAMKPTTPYGQMPTLKIGNVVLAQSGAIERYLAGAAKLYGANAVEQAQIDMVVEGTNEANAVYFPIQFGKASADEKKAKYDAYFKDVFPRWGEQLTKLLKANGGGNGFFVGATCTYADIHFYRYVVDMRATNAEAFKPYPELSALLDRVAAQPNIAAYLKARPVTEH